jgi:hypothetical protein
LQGDELSFVLTRHWRKLGLTLDEPISLTRRPLLQSRALPAATSGFFTDCSFRSNAS